jgi:hypothetical protein
MKDNQPDEEGNHRERMVAEGFLSVPTDSALRPETQTAGSMPLSFIASSTCGVKT